MGLRAYLKKMFRVDQSPTEPELSSRLCDGCGNQLPVYGWTLELGPLRFHNDRTGECVRRYLATHNFQYKKEVYDVLAHWGMK